MYFVCGLQDVFHHPQTKRDRDAALRPGRSMSASSLIGRLGQALSGYPPTPVSMSLTGSCFSSDSAPRPFHHGDSKTRWNNLLDGLAVSMTAGPSDRTISPHPSSREGHHSTIGWKLDFLLSHLILHSSQATATSLVHRNSVPSTHMRCMITANRRAVPPALLNREGSRQAP